MQKHILKYLMYCERKSCMNKNEKIGELYKELRLARGLKLKDIATKKLTVSQLSKFERGRSMLSADRFLLAISGLNMNFAEFAHAMDDYQPSRLLILTLEVPFIVHSLFGQHIRIPQELISEQQRGEQLFIHLN